MKIKTGKLRISRSKCSLVLMFTIPLVMQTTTTSFAENRSASSPAPDSSQATDSAPIPAAQHPNESNSSRDDLLKSSTTIDPAEIEKWDFGVVTERTGATKNWKLHPVVVVPNLPGVQYAWKLKLKNKNPVFVHEEFTLPEPPSTWKIKEGEAASELTRGGQQCILESFQPSDEGWIGHAWTVSNGDPAGKYEIKIWLNGKLAHDFTFNVGEAAKIGKAARDW